MCPSDSSRLDFWTLSFVSSTQGIQWALIAHFLSYCLKSVSWQWGEAMLTLTYFVSWLSVIADLLVWYPVSWKPWFHCFFSDLLAVSDRRLSLGPTPPFGRKQSSWCWILIQVSFMYVELARFWLPLWGCSLALLIPHLPTTLLTIWFPEVKWMCSIGIFFQAADTHFARLILAVLILVSVRTTISMAGLLPPSGERI